MDYGFRRRSFRFSKWCSWSRRPPFVTVLMARNDNAVITRANIILTLGFMSLFTLGTQIFYGMVTLELVKFSFILFQFI